MFLIFFECVEEVVVLDGYMMGYMLYLFFFDFDVGFVDLWFYGIFVEEIFVDLEERI